MRLSKSPTVSLEGDRIVLLSKTVAQLPAEQSLTILIGVYPVKRLCSRSPSGRRHRDEVVALLALAQHEVAAVKRLAPRRERPRWIAHWLAVHLDGALRDELSRRALGARQPAHQQQIDQ